MSFAGGICYTTTCRWTVFVATPWGDVVVYSTDGELKRDVLTGEEARNYLEERRANPENCVLLALPDDIAEEFMRALDNFFEWATSRLDYIVRTAMALGVGPYEMGRLKKMLGGEIKVFQLKFSMTRPSDVLLRPGVVARSFVDYLTLEGNCGKAVESLIAGELKKRWELRRGP